MKMEADFAARMIRASCDGHLGSLVIANPPRKNAITAAMWRAIPDAVRWLVAEAQARVIVLSGAGDADFSAGADISEFAEVRADAATARLYEMENSAAFSSVRRCSVPVIAAIRGICYGGGFGLAAAADIRIADSTARFCVPPARLGLSYPADAVADLVHALGQQMARLALFTGEAMLPEQLLARGFLLECVEREALETTAQTIARIIARNAPMSVRASKLAIRSVVEDDETALQDAATLGSATFDSADYAEGRRAFAERRKPEFTGR